MQLWQQGSLLKVSGPCIEGSCAITARQCLKHWRRARLYSENLDDDGGHADEAEIDDDDDEDDDEDDDDDGDDDDDDDDRDDGRWLQLDELGLKYLNVFLARTGSSFSSNDT